MEFLRTSRTTLRPLQDSDIEPLRQMMTDAEVMQWTGFKSPQTEARIQELLLKWKTEGQSTFGVWAAEHIPSRRFVGWFMLKKTVSEDPELGFMLHKDFWDKGFATEISLEFLKYAFTKLNLPRVIASVSPQNLASVRVLQKLGMTKCQAQPKDGVIYFEIFAPSVG